MENVAGELKCSEKAVLPMLEVSSYFIYILTALVREPEDIGKMRMLVRSQQCVEGLLVGRRRISIKFLARHMLELLSRFTTQTGVILASNGVEYYIIARK
jgi:hypothetical protein